MGELILFSLRNRFYNKATVLLNAIIAGVIIFIFSIDLLVVNADPEFFNKPQLMIADTIIERFPNSKEYLQEEYHIVEKRSEDTRQLTLKEGKWILSAGVEIDAAEIKRLETCLTHIVEGYQKKEIKEHYQPLFDTSVSLAISNKEKESVGKETGVFVAITAIYFMMLSYSAMIANEVVHEKTSRVLELILTSVSTRVHLLSKMMISWLTILIQLGIVTGFTVLIGILRFIHDYGEGMISFLVKIGLLENQFKNFASFFYIYSIDQKSIINIAWAILFLFVGILFVQLILVILSSYVRSVEESASIQGPFYFFLLFVYYFVLSINTPEQLNNGIGWIGSFLPFFSMLLMPARLIMGSVSFLEKIVSLLIATITLTLVVIIGEKYYMRGILDSRLRKQKG